jgi:hypothetical protein
MRLQWLNSSAQKASRAVQLPALFERKAPLPPQTAPRSKIMWLLGNGCVYGKSPLGGDSFGLSGSWYRRQNRGWAANGPNPFHDRAAACEHSEVGRSPQSCDRGSRVERHNHTRGGVPPLSDVGRGVLCLAARVGGLWRSRLAGGRPSRPADPASLSVPPTQQGFKGL